MIFNTIGQVLQDSSEQSYSPDPSSHGQKGLWSTLFPQHQMWGEESRLNRLAREHIMRHLSPLQWGTDLQSEHEWYLVSHCGQLPVFVTHYPAAIKPFYAKATDDSNDTVSTIDAHTYVIPSLLPPSIPPSLPPPSLPPPSLPPITAKTKLLF